MVNFLNRVKDFSIKLFRIKEWKKNKNKWPKREQWSSFFSSISKTEKILFFSFSTIAIISSIFWWRASYLGNTKIVPAEGGKMVEIIVGQPQSLNPLFSPLNDADRDISELIFSGLLKYDQEGRLVKDLAGEYKQSPDGKSYIFSLKEDLSWSDGEEIKSQDIIFTIETLQNPEIQTPLRLNWQEVKMEKIDEKTVKFTLPHPYLPFLENFTLKILPYHIFKDVEPSEFFLKPREEMAFSGPFKIKSIEKDKEEKITKLILDKNPHFHAKTPYLAEIEIWFVEDQEEILSLKDKATNFPNISPKQKLIFKKDFNIYSLSSPRYFALFLNQKNKILSQRKIREALAFATPKKEIINKVLSDEGRQVNGPFLPENKVGGEIKKYEFNLEKAKKVLTETGWKDENNDGIREKSLKLEEKPTSLKFNLCTVEQKELKETAKIIKEKWQEIGVKINIKALEGERLRQEYIIERKYDILLIGQGLYMKADPFSFWHSTQKDYPGSNFSLYEDSKVDEILEKSVEQVNEKKRKKLLQSFQKKLTEDVPVIFLYSPDYLYAVRNKIKGIEGKYIIDPSKRFEGIENWYIEEKRVPK